VTQQIGLAEPTLPMVAFGTQAIDLDQDGSSEIVITNGHVAKLSRTGEPAQYAQAMQIFEDNGNGVYRLVTMEDDQEYLKSPHVGRSLWTIDANRDSKIDVVVTHKNEPVSLLMNQSPSIGAWLNLRLVGSTSSRDAIGAVVEVSASGANEDGKNRQTLFMTSGGGYQCSNEAMLQACLDDSVASADVTVRWPSGKTEKFERLSLRTSWMLIENSGAGFELN
jgi:ASPIC and UnbV